MPEFGYKERERGNRRERSLSRSQGADRADKKRSKEDKKEKKEGKRKRERGDDGREERGDRAERGDRGGGDMPAPATRGAPADRARLEGARGSWRDELEKTEAAQDDEDSDVDGGIEMDETEEDVERKLAESRARREALIAKWVNRGEDGVPQFENTNTPLCDEEAGSDNEEVTAFFAARQAELREAPAALVDEKELEERRVVARFILHHRAEKDGDMFTENTDAQAALQKAEDASAAISQTGASGDDWNDAEGYYKAKIGEIMVDRYRVTEDMCGKGTFSNVIKAEDMTNKMQVAIKVMRCNDMMRKAAEKEIDILCRLRDSDKENKRNVIRLLRQFMYRGHLCLVFECMWDNLRMAVKKYTKDKGMSLKAVRAYTRQLLIALQHIHRLQLIHADIKPDNILISAGHNIVKICDLGSAMELTEVEVTPYLVSRFYRAPEIVLGIKYGQASDTFALGATLCEIFTGKILFPGKSNNDMLRHFMEVKGKMPHKMIKSGTTWKQHFNEELDFKYLDTDPVTRKRKTRIVSDLTCKKPIIDMVMNRVGPEKQKSTDAEDHIYVKKSKQFADLIGQMTMLDPEKRPTTGELLKHPFVAEAWPTPKGTPAAKGAAKPAASAAKTAASAAKPAAKKD